MKYLFSFALFCLSFISALGQSNISDNAEIMRQILQDERATVAYLYEGMLGDVRITILRKIKGVREFNFFELPLPEKTNFMLVLSGEGDNSKNLVRNLITNLIKSDRNLKTIGKSKNGPVTTTILGIPSDQDNGNYSVIIYYTKNSESSSIAICGDNNNLPPSFKKILSAYMEE